MQILYGEERTTTHRFTINQGGELNIRLSRFNVGQDAPSVEIVFQGKKFLSCKFPFTGMYERQHWHILAAINAKISELEERYNAPTEAENVI